MSARGWTAIWTLLLTGSWCLLQGSAGLGSVLLGLLIAYGIAHWLARDRGGRRMRLGVLARLSGRVAWDIVVSNFVVARQVLFQADRLQPAWVEVPLELPDNTRAVALAAIITLTPGTLSAVTFRRDDRRWLRVHALDAPDPEAVAAAIHERYQTLLLELFE